MYDGRATRNVMLYSSIEGDWNVEYLEDRKRRQ